MEAQPLEWFREQSRSRQTMIVVSVVESLVSWGLWIMLSSRVAAVQRRLNECRALTPQYEG